MGKFLDILIDINLVIITTAVTIFIVCIFAAYTTGFICEICYKVKQKKQKDERETGNYGLVRCSQGKTKMQTEEQIKNCEKETNVAEL